MQITIEKNGGGHLVAASLTLVDKDNGDEATMTAKMTIPHGETIETLTDPAKTRLVAATLVGRMTTKWKLVLIDSIGEAVLAALQTAILARQDAPPVSDSAED